jgi:ABC-2 type transport system permease protein
MLFAVICSLSLAVLAIAFAGVVLTPAQWALLFVVNVLGVLPFSAIGLWLGSLVGGDGAPAVVNMVYLPMSFLSGLWIPLAVLPAFVAKAAPLWPAYHLGQIALKVVGKDAGGSFWLHLSVLFAITVAFSLLARRRLSRVG